MEVTKERDGNRLTVKVEGKIDTLTAPELEAAIDGGLEGVDRLVFDFAKLDYTSSAGLRVLLRAQQTMDGKDGEMTVRNVNDMVMEIFEETGFTNILDIED